MQFVDMSLKVGKIFVEICSTLIEEVVRSFLHTRHNHLILTGQQLHTCACRAYVLGLPVKVSQIVVLRHVCVAIHFRDDKLIMCDM